MSMNIKQNEKMSMNIKQNVEERVKIVVAKALTVGPEKVVREARFVEDLGADSLDTVELVMALEEEFGSDIPDSAAEKLTSVGDAINYVENALSANTNSSPVAE